MTWPRSGVVNPPMWSAGRQTQRHHTLFDARSKTRFSHVFTVDAVGWVVQAYGLKDGQCVCLEMVTGCHDGTDFEPVKASCGCCLCLSPGRNVIPIPLEGRYRVVACEGVELGDFKVIAYPSTIPQDVWSSWSMSCCTEKAETVTTITPIPGGFVYVNEAGAVQTILFPTLEETVTTIVPTGNGFQYTNEAGAVQTITFPPDIVTTLGYNPATQVLTYVNEAGAVQTVDLSALAADINVQNLTYDPATQTITLTETDGTAHAIALSDLVDPETITTLVPIPGGWRYTNEAGVQTNIILGALAWVLV